MTFASVGMDRILLLCCRSCLRGDGDNNEYYEVLGLHDKNANQETIKKAFKKTSLNLHPDKLAQRGIEVTAENKQMFLKVRLFDLNLSHFVEMADLTRI